ncbi:hypothetical protein QFC22_006663 [Naganishia vaughanmartiniae]|uniref:Uncharacterized protein n=1 Tax=Naganishia vaughanmartiniae TaxID=1424756 RepID=A0ACC2WJT1_9TREE|nr:hypothetical protein QFC22_006663 [Naganishia vaughanmartiniae]
MAHPPIQPLNPQRLVTILAHLLPPAYPLASDLLSSAIKTRQLYLPPNPSNATDDRFIAQRPRQTDPKDDPEELSTRLRAIAASKTHARDPEFSNELQLQGEGNDIEVALYKESWNVRYRALDEQTLIAKLDLLPYSGNEEGGVRILFFPEHELSEDDNDGSDSARIQSVDAGAEGPRVSYRTQLSMGDEWKLFDVKPLEEAEAEEQQTPTSLKAELWCKSPREAFEAIKQAKQSQGDGEVGGEDQPEDDDYWGGYSDSEQEAQHPSGLSAQQDAASFGDLDSEKHKQQESNEPKGLPAPVTEPTSALPAQSYTTPLSVTPHLTTTAASPNLSNPAPSIVSGTNKLPDQASTIPGAAVLVKKVTISPFVSRFTTPVGGFSGGGDDAYWSSYGGVEDGLKVSNPPSPRGVSRLSTPAGGYWGTGGESPVSWSPPPPANQALPATSSAHTPSPHPDAAEQDTNSAKPVLDPQERQIRLQQAAQSAQMRTNAVFASHDGHVDLSSPALDFAPDSPVVEPTVPTGQMAGSAVQERQAVLRVTLAGLRSMYLGAAAGSLDQAALAREFAQVLGEFM